MRVVLIAVGATLLVVVMTLSSCQESCDRTLAMGGFSEKACKWRHG
jgi:hypothetical protein